MTFEIKTDQNCSFNILALRLLSECSRPFSFKGDHHFYPDVLI